MALYIDDIYNVVCKVYKEIVGIIVKKLVLFISVVIFIL